MTGLIGLAIIGIWLVVLIPMWLNRHEADDASRSMDSFSTAMTVLSKRTANQGVTVDNYLPAGQTDSPARRRPSSVVGAVGRAGLMTRPQGRARLMARRRRVAAALAGLLLVLALTALLGVTSWWYTLAVALATVGYAVHLRNEAIRDRKLRRRRLARRTTQWEERSFDEPPYAAPRAAERFVSEEAVLPAPAVSSTGTANGSRWEPMPVPLPTYVSKPVATRPPAPAPRADVDATGTIDLTNQGAWTEQHSAHEERVDDRHLLDAPAASPGLEEDELDLILERRRAVGD
jgi:hypothetical protein